MKYLARFIEKKYAQKNDLNESSVACDWCAISNVLSSGEKRKK
jgi:hypothetical protein